MTQATPAITQTFKLSDRLSLTMTVSAAGITGEWEPGPPDEATQAEIAAYRVARQLMLERLAEEVGGPVACVEG